MIKSTQRNVMIQVEEWLYRSSEGFSAQIEEGVTPNGNPVGHRWVLRDAEGKWVDVDQYRHDLFERNGLRTDY